MYGKCTVRPNIILYTLVLKDADRVQLPTKLPLSTAASLSHKIQHNPHTQHTASLNSTYSRKHSCTHTGTQLDLKFSLTVNIFKITESSLPGNNHNTTPNSHPSNSDRNCICYYYDMKLSHTFISFIFKYICLRNNIKNLSVKNFTITLYTHVHTGCITTLGHNCRR